MKTFKAQVEKINDTKEGAIVYLKVPENYSFKEGQYLFIVHNNKKKPFSIVKKENNSLVLFIKSEEIITYLKNNKTVEISEALGNFTFEKLVPFKKIVYVAAGSGIAPVLGLVEKLKDKEQLVIYQEKTKSDLVFLDELKKYAEVIPILSIEENYEKKGHVQDFIDEFVDKEAAYVLIGPSSFVKEIKELLTSKGVKDEQIFFAY